MDLELKLRQTQTLSPQMLQAVKLLQMDTLELRDYLQEQIQENPVLEGEEHRASQEIRWDAAWQKLEWLRSSDVQNRVYYREDERDMSDPADETGDPAELTLYAYLRSQVSFHSLPPEVREAVDCVLQSLDGDGRLDESVRDLSERTGLPEADLERAVELVQALDPAGVGARSLAECLALQLRRAGETGLALTIVERHLEDLSRDHYNRIARLTGTTQNRVREACQLIRNLDPRPGAAFAAREPVRYILPDLTVFRAGDRFEVSLNDTYAPQLHISAFYCQLMESTDEVEVRDYLTDKVRQASWVVRSVEQRRSTLLSCARCIVDWQENFFRQGPAHLRPMSLADAAKVLGFHESTVSRAVRSKYLQCAYGVFPLKYFFCQALPTQGDASAERARLALRRLVDEEDRKKPLSDQRLSELLAAQGMAISRRTVAKYREELGIPSTSGRRE